MKYDRADIRESAVEWAGVILRYHSSQHRPVVKHTRALLDQTTWWWLYDKPLDTPHWSKAAVASFERHGRVVTKVGKPDSLVREHVVPRKVIIDLLLGLPDPNPIAIRSIFERFHVVAVVTREEHSRLPDAVDLEDVWNRYNVAGIEMVGPPSQ